MPHTVTLIPGDGIGPEVTQVALDCIKALGVDIQFEKALAGEAALKEFNTPLPKQTISSIKKNKVCLKGPLITPIAGGFRSVNVAIRQILNLYACVRPCKSYAGVRSRYAGINLVIIRENTEDLYTGIEFDKGKTQTKKIISTIEKFSGKKIRGDSSISIKPISAFASKRIIRFAFEYALKNKRKKVTAVHKANIMKFTDGLFLKCARNIAKEYEGRIEFSEAIVDNMSMQLVKYPYAFDVLVLPNLYGDIISDLCAGLIGGLGIAPGVNFGRDCAVFEAVHGAAPKYSGLNRVNPTAMVLSAVLMLRHLGLREKADILENAVSEVIREGKYVTYDFKEDPNDKSIVGTKEMGQAIIEKIKNFPS